MKDFRNLKQKLVGVGKAPPIRAAETPAKPSVVRPIPAKPSVVRPIEERETIEIERRGLAEIYIVRAAPYTDRATLPSSQSTAGPPVGTQWAEPQPEAPPAEPERTPLQKAILEFVKDQWPNGNIPRTAKVQRRMAESEVWTKKIPDWHTVNRALDREV